MDELFGDRAAANRAFIATPDGVDAQEVADRINGRFVANGADADSFRSVGTGTATETGRASPPAARRAFSWSAAGSPASAPPSRRRRRAATCTSSSATRRSGARRPAAPVLPQALPAVLRAGDQLPSDPIRPSTLQGLHPGPGGTGGGSGRQLRGDGPPRARFVLMERCIACNRCAEVCPAERPNAFNYGLDTTKAAYLPNPMAFPMKYVIDRAACLGEAVLGMRRGVSHQRHRPGHGVEDDHAAGGGRHPGHRAGSPTTPTSSPSSGTPRTPTSINNVEMERLAAVDGPTGGCLKRPSDGRPAKRVAFVQCAGSRDVNHLPVLLLDLLPRVDQGGDLRPLPVPGLGGLHLLHRHPGARTQRGLLPPHRRRSRRALHQGQGGQGGRDRATGDMVVEADDMLSGARPGCPSTSSCWPRGWCPRVGGRGIPGLPVEYDEYGFALENREAGVFVAGVAHRPADVVTTVRDATGAALKAIRATL